MRSCLGVVIAWAMLAAPIAQAALDPEVERPYDLDVVLHVGDSPLLTDVFRERIERGLQDYLQASFGGLAQVKVRSNHPRLAAILASGLQRGLDGWTQRSETKTHFVLIDYVGAYYVIQSRQHDGLTGQASPVVRVERTRDRAFVARTAALLIERDFGLIGSFDAWPFKRGPGPAQPVRLTLKLKGAGLGVPLTRWIRAGEVFRIVQVPAGSGDAVPIDFALLRVVEAPKADGSCVCDLFWRYQAPAEGANLGGYRCLHVATGQHPIRLKVTQRSATGAAAPLSVPLSIEVRRNGFAGEDESRLRGNTDATGSFDTLQLAERGLFDRMAFVTLQGAGPAVRFPLALVSDQTVTVSVDRANPAGEQFARRLADWRRDVADAFQIQQSIFKDLETRAAKATNPEGRKATLEQARDGVRRTREDHTRLVRDRDELLNEAPAAQKEALRSPSSGENRLLKSLMDGEQVLQKFIDNQTSILKEETDPNRLAALDKFGRGQLLERETEYFRALELYKQALEQHNIAAIRKRHDDLQKDLAPRDDAHRNAQLFIFDSYPRLDTTALHERRVEAERACDACIAAGDARSLERLLKATAAHLTRMVKELAQLKPDVNVDDEKPAQVIRELSEGLRKLVKKADDGLERLRPARPQAAP